MESKENQFILFQTFPMDNVLSIIIPIFRPTELYGRIENP